MGFQQFRFELAKAAGINYERWGEELAKLIEDGKLDEDLRGDYLDWIPTDPIKYLLAHSDCDGQLQPRQAVLIADRLMELLHKLPSPTPESGNKNWQERARKFAFGCYQAAARGEVVDFH